MKKLLFSLVIMSLLIFLTAGSAYAQTSVKADIPFAFTVSGKSLLAGSYTVSQYGTAIQALLIQELKNPEGQAYVLTSAVETDPGKPLEQPRLVFRRYGEQYFLGQVWMGAGNTTGRAVEKSAKERQVAKNSPQPELIYVAAK
ncbi:MAG TPA: hypothetical protein VFJ27_09515 [Terriglobia bacterium]|nr:hypothetical protein [Terriglobia bacterium]